VFTTTLLDFAKNNKWLAYLIVITALLASLGGIIVDCVAYFQPRIENKTFVINRETVKDRTVTTITTKTNPDGTVQKLERIEAAIDRFTVESIVKSEVKEPVAIAGKSSLWAVHGAYAPLQRELSLGAGFQLLPSLVVGVSAPVAVLQADYAGIDWATTFRPQVFGTWTLPRFR